MIASATGTLPLAIVMVSFAVGSCSSSSGRIPVAIRGADIAVVVFTSGEDCAKCILAMNELREAHRRTGDSIAVVGAIECDGLADFAGMDAAVSGYDYLFADSADWRARNGLPEHTRYAVWDLNRDTVVATYDGELNFIRMD